MAKVLSGPELDQFIEELYAERKKFESLFEKLQAEAHADLKRFRRRCWYETVTKPRLYSWLTGFVAAVIILLLALSRIGLAAFIIVFRNYTAIRSRFDRQYYYSNTSRKDHPNLYKFLDECNAEINCKPVKEACITVGSGIAITYEKKSFFSPAFPVLRIGILLIESLTEEQFRDVVLHTLRKHQYGSERTRYAATDVLTYGMWPAIRSQIPYNFYNTKAFWNVIAWLNALSAECCFRADKESLEQGSQNFLIAGVIESEKAILDRCFNRTANKIERGESDAQFAVYTYFEEFRILIQTPEYRRKCLGQARSKQDFENVEILLGDRLERLSLGENTVQDLLNETIRIKDTSAGDSFLGSEVQSFISDYLNYRIGQEHRTRDRLRTRTDLLRYIEDEYGALETYAFYEMDLFDRESDLPTAIKLAETYASQFPESSMIQFELAKRLANCYEVRAIDVALKALEMNPRYHEQASSLITSVSSANGIEIPEETQKKLLRAEYLAINSEKSLLEKHYKNFEQYIPRPAEKEAFRLLCQDCGLGEAYTLRKLLPDGTWQKYFVYVTVIGKKTPSQLQEEVLASDYALLEYHYFNLPPGNPLIINLRKQPDSRVV